MRKILSFYLVFALGVLPSAQADNPYEKLADHTIRESWNNARSWAHFLVVTDVVNALSNSYGELVRSTLSDGEYARIRESQEALRNAFGKLATTNDQTEARAALVSALDLYEDLIRKRFTNSWEVVIVNYRRELLSQLVLSAVQEFKATCEMGRSSPNADVYIPAMKAPSLGVSTSISPDLANYFSVSISYNSGSKSDWQRSKPALKMMAHTVSGAMASTGAGIPVALVVEMVFAILDKFISSSELNSIKARIAKAQKRVYDNRANGGDISRLYKEYCSKVSEGFGFLEELLTLSTQEQAPHLEYARSDEFKGKVDSWLVVQQKAAEASCRVQLYESSKAKSCKEKNVEYIKPKLVEEPSCKRDSMRRIFVGPDQQSVESGLKCPMIKTAQDSLCRKDGDEVFNLFDEKCRINTKNYGCNEDHFEDLKKLGRDGDIYLCQYDRELRQLEKELEALQEVRRQLLFKGSSCRNPNATQTIDCEEWNKKRADNQENIRKKEAELENKQAQRYKVTEGHREDERTRLEAKVKENSELIGYLMLRLLDRHDQIYAELEKSEQHLEASRRAAEQRLLYLIELVHKTNNLEPLNKEMKAFSRFIELRQKLVHIGAQASRNIFSNESVDEQRIALSVLHYEINEFLIFSGVVEASELLRHCESLIEILGGFN